MTVSGVGMLMSFLAVLASHCSVLLRLFVLADFVMSGRLVMMVGGGVMVRRGLVVVIARGMLG